MLVVAIRVEMVVHGGEDNDGGGDGGEILLRIIKVVSQCSVCLPLPRAASVITDVLVFVSPPAFSFNALTLWTTKAAAAYFSSANTVVTAYFGEGRVYRLSVCCRATLTKTIIQIRSGAGVCKVFWSSRFNRKITFLVTRRCFTNATVSRQY